MAHDFSRAACDADVYSAGVTVIREAEGTKLLGGHFGDGGGEEYNIVLSSSSSLEVVTVRQSQHETITARGGAR